MRLKKGDAPKSGKEPKMVKSLRFDGCPQKRKRARNSKKTKTPPYGRVFVFFRASQQS